MKKHRKTLVQYLYDAIPVGKRVHTYDPKYPASCPTCQAPLEDRTHLWNCQHASRHKWRAECKSAMLKVLTDSNTAVPLQELLLEAIAALMEGRNMDTIRVDPSVEHVAKAQADIGWHQLLKGRFSKAWRLAQDQYLGSGATRKNNGTTWMVKIIETWLQEWLKLWKLRNEDRHGRDKATRMQAEERQAVRELEQFFEANDGIVVPRLQWLFDNYPINECRGWRTGKIRIWLNTWKPVVDESYNTALTAD